MLKQYESFVQLVFIEHLLYADIRPDIRVSSEPVRVPTLYRIVGEHGETGTIKK